VPSSAASLRRDFTPGAAFARTLWSDEWLDAHTWAAEDEPGFRQGEVVFVGPAGTGKTRNVMERLHAWCLERANLRVLIAREYRTDLTESALFTYEKEVLPEGTLGGVVSDAPIRWDSYRQAYHYPNGSEMVVRGLRDGGSGIFSQQYDVIFLNEAGVGKDMAGGLNLDDYQPLLRALRNHQMRWGLLLSDMNPDYEHHWLHDRCDRGVAVEVPTTHADNPTATAAYLHGLSTLAGDMKERLFHGRRVSALPGAYYQQQLAELRRDGRLTKVPLLRGTPVFSAWDIGWSDYTAIWLCQVHRGEWRWVGYYEDRQAELGAYAAWLVGWAIGHRITYAAHYLPHDAANKTLAAGGHSVEEQLAAIGIVGTVVPPAAINAQHQAVRTALGSSWFDNSPPEDEQEGEAKEGVYWGLQRLASYRSEKSSKLDVFNPQPRHDLASHGASAMSTGVRGFDPDLGKKPKALEPHTPAWMRLKARA
jgi:hypothetical protein